MFDSLLKNQPSVIKLFQNAYQKNRLVQTYLFEGPKGTSKLDAAYYLSAMILCNSEYPPCLKCDECLKVINHQHYNIFYIEPEKDIIKKEQITALEHEFSHTALGSSKRIFIINGIDKCNIQSANSLLKFLEEGSDNCYGILITEQINNVLPTIRSRSQIISFKAISKELIADQLAAQGISKDMSKIVASITNNVEDAKTLISQGLIIDLVELVKELGMAFHTNNQPLLTFIDKGTLVLNEGKDVQEMFLNLLLTFFNDELYYQLNEVTKIVFADEINLISPSLNDSLEDIMNRIQIILKYKERIKYNVNLDLMYAQMFVELGGK